MPSLRSNSTVVEAGMFFLTMFCFAYQPRCPCRPLAMSKEEDQRDDSRNNESTERVTSNPIDEEMNGE